MRLSDALEESGMFEYAKLLKSLGKRIEMYSDLREYYLKSTI